MEFFSTHHQKLQPHFKNLKRALQYKNEPVVLRFMVEYGVEKKVANLLFKDMIRFLWIAHFIRSIKNIPQIKAQLKFQRAPLYLEMAVIDEMWHTFVLFTVDYEKFCKEYFGQMIPHFPETDGVELMKKLAIPAEKQIMIDRYNSFVEFVALSLGTAVANRWFYDYPKNYRLKINKSIKIKSKA